MLLMYLLVVYGIYNFFKRFYIELLHQTNARVFYFHTDTSKQQDVIHNKSCLANCGCTVELYTPELPEADFNLVCICRAFGLRWMSLPAKEPVDFW